VSGVLYSVAGGGAVYDVLGVVHWFMMGAHNGAHFSSFDADNDLWPPVNCGHQFGGGWWFTRCSLFTTNTVSPVWFSWSDNMWYSLKKSRLMVKIQ